MAPLISAFLFAAMIVLQITLVPLFEIKGVTPDLILILVVLTSFQRGRVWGMLFAFCAGFLYDAFGTGLLGLSSLAYVVSAFVAGLWREQPERRFGAIFGPLLFTLFVHDFLYFSFLRIGTSVGFWKTLVVMVMPATLYSLIFLCVVYLAAPMMLLRRRTY